MDVTQAKKNIVSHFTTGWVAKHPDVRVMYDNVDIDINQLEEYLEFSVLFDDATQANIGENPFHRFYGTIEISMFVHRGTGTGVVLKYLGELGTLFGFKNLGGVHTQVPRIGGELSRGNWYSQVLRVSFYADSNT